MDAEAYADMLPWLVFIVMDRKHGLGVAWAGGGALVCEAGLVGWSYWRGRSAFLQRAGLVLFASCLISGLALPAWNHEVGRSRALVVAMLSVMALVSLRFTPLSETYSEHLVAPGIRMDPRFRKVNAEMTLAWGIGALAVAAACGTTVVIAGPVPFTLLSWVTPLVLCAATILWCARRWELFSLSIDAQEVGHQTTDMGVAQPAVRDALVFSAPSNEVVAAVPVELPEPSGRASRGAVIHQLPLRHRNG